MGSATNRRAAPKLDWSQPHFLAGLNWPLDDPESKQIVRYRFRGSRTLCEQIGSEISTAYGAGDWDAHPPLTIEIDVASEPETAELSLTWDLAGNSAAADTEQAYELIRIYLSRHYAGWLEKLEPHLIEVGQL